MALYLGYGGSSLYVPKKDAIYRMFRDMQIKKEYTGSNKRALARKYHLGTRQISSILSRP
jgi:Mor family transcriptional regulator